MRNKEQPMNPLTMEKIDSGDSIREQVHAEVVVLTEAINLLTTSIIATEKGIGYCEDKDDRLEQLQREWKLEETGFVRLYNVCMQMKQSIYLAAVEADDAVKDVNKANNLLVHERYEVEKMKTVMRRLYNENHQLRERNEELEYENEKYNKEKNKISRSLKKLVKSWRKEREDMKNQLEAASEIKGLNGDREDGTESTCTVASSTSLITDDGCATLRLEKYDKNKSRSFFAHFHRAVNSDPTYEITFKTSSPGLQFLPFEKHEPDDVVNYEFLVCGFKGFRDNQHRRPSFGARLINVDGKYEDKLAKCTMSDLVSYLREKKGPVKMTFRNDDITSQRMDALIKRAEELGFRVRK